MKILQYSFYLIFVLFINIQSAIASEIIVTDSSGLAYAINNVQSGDTIPLFRIP